VFGDPPTPGSTSGLKVWNASGELVFDALQKYMRVVGMLVTTSLGQTLTTPTGRTCASVTVGGFYTDVQNAGPGSYVYYAIRFGGKVITNAIQVNGVCMQYEITGSPGVEIPASNSLTLAIDVTDY
jgi:hypothetical protein